MFSLSMICTTFLAQQQWSFCLGFALCLRISTKETCPTISQQFELNIRGYLTTNIVGLLYLEIPHTEKGLLTTTQRGQNFTVYEIHALALAPFGFIISKAIRRM
jgi:hypothetical protein